MRTSCFLTVIAAYSVNFLLLRTECETLTQRRKTREVESSTMCQLNQAVFYKGLCVTCVRSKALTSKEGLAMKSNALELVMCPENEKAFRIHQGAIYLNGRRLKVVTIERPPFVQKTTHNYTGVIFEFLHVFEEKYNFSMDSFLPYDGNWGARTKNGTWNGMIGMVIRNEADIGAAGFSVTYERATVVDFTFAFHQEPSAILIPPPTEGEKLTVLIRPLSKQVWATTLGTVFLVLPSLYLLHQGSKSARGLMTTTAPFAMASELLWFILASILQQSVISPAEKSTRFVTFIWWSVTFVLANAYLAFLVSFLSSPRLHDVVDSLERLAVQKKIKWTFRSNTVHRSLFMSESSSGTYKLIGDRTDESNLVSSDLEGVVHVLNQHQAFIKEKSFLDVALGKDFDEFKKCRMTIAKKTFFTAGIALAVKKDSPILALLDYSISNTVATGVMEKWKQLHWPRSLWCEDAVHYITSIQPKARKLSLSDLQGAYFLLAAGLAMSLTAFIANLLTHSVLGSLRFHVFRLKFTKAWRFIR